MAGSPTDRPLRADARRNRDRLLEQARTAFADHGVDTSLEEIAARAGVGVGTLYRHFPTRDTLLETVLRERFDALTTATAQLLREPDPRTALLTWTRQFIDTTTAYRGLTVALTATLRDPRSALHASCERMRTAGGELLDRAKAAGRVRADLRPDEFVALAAGVAWVGEQLPQGADHRERLLTLLFEGFDPPID